MDRRSLILLIITGALLVLWYPLMYRIYPPQPLPQDQLGPGAAGAAVGTNGVAGAPSASPLSASVATTPLRAGVADSGFQPVVEQPAQILALENDVARYVFTSHGGGIQEVELKQFRDAIICRDFNGRSGVGNARINRGAATPMFALLGLENAGSSPVYELQQSNDVVVATRNLGNDLRVVKEFRLQTNYVLKLTARLQNWGANPRSVPTQEWVFGTAAPLHYQEQELYRGMFVHDGSSSDHIGEGWFRNRTLGCLPGTPRATYLSEGTNTAWAAVHNQFFAALVLPQDRATRVFARKIDLSLTNGVPDPATVSGYQGALVYAPEEIPAQQERVREFELYVGPRKYNTLSGLGPDTDAVMGFDNYFGGRFSGFFARALLLAMNGFHSLGLSYALAIIAITVIVRLLFWPLMQASARTSKRMAALQPQIKELQEKYKDNPQKMNQKMLELWRENKVNPAAGCLPILIQFPILLGFYAMLQTAIELRGERFLWACDLSQSDTVAVIPGLDFPINPLPILMGITMLWQARLTPMSPSMDATQQKIMKYLPLMFMVFLYNFSAGLTLYWTVSNLLSILQMKLTRAQDERRNAAPRPPGTPPAPVRKNRQNGRPR